MIAEMSTYAASIAAAMEEQGAATQEITRNVQQAARRHRAGHAATSQACVKGLGQTERGGDRRCSVRHRNLPATTASLSQEVGMFLSNVKAA